GLGTLAMHRVTIIDHPLVRHKLTIMSDRNTPPKTFREAMRETATLLCYGVTRDLEMEQAQIDTPMTAMRAEKIAGKKLVFAPILRAGVGLLEGMLDMVPSARVAHIGLYRDP